MNRKLSFVVCFILFLGCFTLTGCKSQDEPFSIGENSSLDQNHYVVYDGEIANYFDYNYEDGSMYLAGLKVFEEFGTSNEGTVTISKDKSILTFRMTKATGSVSGTVDGPLVYFKMNLLTNEIIEKCFEPAPNYVELGMEEFSDHSEEIIELTDERMIEIGVYFKELIMDIVFNKQLWF